MRTKTITWFVLLLALCVVPKLAYCDEWNIATSKDNIDQINKINSSLPFCIQKSLPPNLNIIVEDNDSNIVPNNRCGYSYNLDKKFIFIALHKKSKPNRCYLIPVYYHELGHYYNWNVGVSVDPDFIAAINEDFSHIKHPSQDALYFKQPEEMAAELFALEFSPHMYYYSKYPIHHMLMFPRSKAIFEAHLCVMP